MEDLVRVYTAPNEVEAEIAKALLEAEGIPVLLKGEGGGPYRTGPVHLWVAPGSEVEARLIIEVAQTGDLADEPGAETSTEPDET